MSVINKININGIDYDIEDKNKATKTSQLENDSNFISQIKTINGESLEGEGDIEIEGGSGDTLPINAIFEYDGDVVPEGYEEVEEEPTIVEEIDPTVPQHVKNITLEDIEKWNSGTGGSGGSSETNLMSLQLTTNQGFSGNTYTKIKFDSVVKVGEKLTFEDNGVKIGKDVKYVKVSAIGNPQTEKTGNAYLRIVKNQLSDPNTVVWVFEKVTSAWGITVLTLPPKLVEVKEGDILYAYVYGEGYTTVGLGNGAEMSLTVEVVEDENTGTKSGGSSSEIYSEEETVIGTWLGKPLYRKVINVDVSSLTAEVNNISYDCSTLDMCTDLRAITERQYNIIETIPRTANSTNLNAWYGGIQLDKAGNKFYIELGSTMKDRAKNGYRFYIIIEYTKTTD